MESYKRIKKIDKILDHLYTLPGIQRGDYYFTESTIETILHFLETKKNYKYYPWEKKILKKRKELFGF